MSPSHSDHWASSQGKRAIDGYIYDVEFKKEFVSSTRPSKSHERGNDQRLQSGCKESRQAHLGRGASRGRSCCHQS